MAGYQPLKITGMTTGLVQNREEFILPDDAYPTLQNAYVWRERILRKSGCQLLGRLNRQIGTTNGSGNLTVTILPQPIQPGLAYFTVGTDQFQDQGGSSPVTMLTNSSGSGTLNRSTGVLRIIGSQPNTAVNYYPGLPVMGLRTRELQNSANDQTVCFDQNYAYVFNGLTNSFVEFLPATKTTWNQNGAAVTGTDFFWSTNYWISDNVNFSSTDQKLFWVTNNTGSYAGNADPIRVTDGNTWLNFSPPTYGQIDSTPTYLVQCLAFLPFRGRMVCFNTWEGASYGSSLNYSNRIRWSTIGNPFIPFAAGPPATGSWRDDIRGQGGYLDIPTSEDIISVGFVRDNLVIFCERSTWQLRYTGRSIAPFQIEKVNSELGAEGPFSSIQFDTSLVCIGDKGIIECDSYKSERIDIKIPDLVFGFQGLANGTSRVHGIRDFINRLAFWTFPAANQTNIFPSQRLVYNYENDSWALFDDSFTCLGNFQPPNSLTWISQPKPWIDIPFSWVDQTYSIPQIIGGNQQGFVEYVDFPATVVNDVTLFISNITADGVNPTIITSPNHNMQTGAVIGISDILATDPFVSLNGGVYGIVVIDANTFSIFTYDSVLDAFSDPVVLASGAYQSGGLINIRDNFSVTSKKFNYLDEGQNIQLGYIDILMSSTGGQSPGAISLNVYLDYDDSTISNIVPQNDTNYGTSPAIPDTFFNAIIPTTPGSYTSIGGTKYWQRVYCATRASFLTLQYTFSNAQMAGIEQTLNVQIDAQVLWMRRAGRMTQG